MQPLRGAAGAQGLTLLPPLANEEAIYILHGSGTLQTGEREVAVTREDYAALPVGEPGAHQIINTSEEPLRYLCFSIMIEKT